MSQQRLIAIMLILFLLSGCASILKKRERSPEIFKINPETLEPDQFPEYIEQLVQATESNSFTANRIKALFMVARAIIHHNNPSPDYPLALSYFEKYLERSADNQLKNETLDWIGILRILVDNIRRLEKSRNDQQRLEEQNQKNSETIRNQEKMIEKLKNDIKQLDSLYFKIEQKKKKKNNHQKTP